MRLMTGFPIVRAPKTLEDDPDAEWNRDGDLFLLNDDGRVDFIVERRFSKGSGTSDAQVNGRATR